MSGLNLSCQSLNHRVLIIAILHRLSLLSQYPSCKTAALISVQYAISSNTNVGLIPYSLANCAFGKWERAWVVLTPYPVQHNARSPIIDRKEFGSWHMEKALCVPRASEGRSSNLPAGGDYALEEYQEQGGFSGTVVLGAVFFIYPCVVCRISSCNSLTLDLFTPSVTENEFKWIVHPKKSPLCRSQPVWASFFFGIQKEISFVEKIVMEKCFKNCSACSLENGHTKGFSGTSGVC